MDQNNKNKPNKPGGNKSGGNWRGVISLICWAVLLTAIFSFAGNYMSNSVRQSSSVELVYGDFLAMLEDGQAEAVAFDKDESILIITPKNGYTYTDSQGVTYTKTGEDDRGNIIYTYLNPIGKEQQTTLRFFTVQTESNDATIARLENAGAQIITEYEPPMSTLMVVLINLLPFVIVILGMSLFMSWMAKKGGMGGMGGIGGVGKANAKVYMEKQTGVTFADVAGQDEAKESLTEIIDFLHNPGKYTEIGAKLPKGALLVGPPGTGKTLLAKAVAGEADVPFFSISGSDFVEIFVGMGASRVRDLFQQAAKVAPCIIFIDEIDAVGRSRDNRFGSNSEQEQTLNQLLSEIDGFESSKGIVCLAATNRPEILDKALLRPGRFDRRIIVDRPNLQGRLDTLKVHTRKIKLSEDVDLRKIAQATAGAVGADLANLVNEAALRAVRMGRKAVNQEDLLVSFETVIAGTEKKNTVLTDMEKRLVAYHEVGHALVAALEKHSQPVSKITIVPHTSGALGYTMQMPEEEKFLNTADELRTELKTLVGGRAAEAVVFGVQTTGASNDIQRATALARNMVTQYGMSEKLGLMSTASVQNQYLEGQAVMDCSQETAAEVDREVKEILDKAFADAKKILVDNRSLLDEISEYLLVKETITGDELMAYVNADKNKLPEAENTEE